MQEGYHWDSKEVNQNLTSQGVFLHDAEKLLVWGNVDKKLAIDNASILPEKIEIIGAPRYDSFFGSNQYKLYDAILAIYHDQGLIPFKTISFGSGVNFTAGLDVVRTSPDHGTGYDIAGKNQADPSSFRSAIFSALLSNSAIFSNSFFEYPITGNGFVFSLFLILYNESTPF